VTVSSRLTGEVGSSSCPTSGMMIATLLLTLSHLLVIGCDGAALLCHRALHRGIVCIASSNGGTISQI